MPRVVVVDPITEFPWSYDVERLSLGQHGVRLVIPAGPVASAHELSEADVVIVSRRLGSAQIASLTRCAGIVCYSVGIDGVDVAAARKAGIPIRSVPDYCRDDVADHAIALLLAAERRLVPFAGRAAAGEWAVRHRPEFASLRRLNGQTLGIVGAGQIGRRVAIRARAFGFRTVAYDPFVEDVIDPDLPLLSLAELLQASDAIVLCASLTAEARGLIDREALGRVRPGVILVNVARGGLIDEEALAEALADGRVAVAALDVRACEPPPPDDPLRRLPNVVLTQHLASVSQESFRDLQEQAAAAVLDLLASARRLPPA